MENNFISSAKGLAKNPLGIIALFIVLIYAVAAITLGTSTSLSPNERLPIIWFLVIFPFVVLLVFAWLVSTHHEKLYAPSDFKTDESFFEATRRRLELAQEIQSDRAKLKIAIENTILEKESQNSIASHTQLLVKKAIEEFESNSNVRVDARNFLNNETAVFDFPVEIFETVSDLTDAVYFKLVPSVKPFEYGFSWQLRNNENNSLIKTVRMLLGVPPGTRTVDGRPLAEIGVFPGSLLTVEKVN